MQIKIIQGFVAQMTVFIIVNERNIRKLEIGQSEAPFRVYEKIMNTAKGLDAEIKDVELIGRTSKLYRMHDIFTENDIPVRWNEAE